MILTIAKVNRTLREGISKKTGKQYSFESLGIAPVEDVLTDINGDEFERAERWCNGISVDGVTNNWDEGDIVKINLVQKTVDARDGGKIEVINFVLPEGTEVMVKKADPVPEEAPAKTADEEVDIEDEF
jgi:hypothetical protein